MFKARSVSQQIADFLREEIYNGKHHSDFPGEDRLVARLGVGRDSIKRALKQLENEGLLVGHGKGRRRQVDLSILKAKVTRKPRLGILSYDVDSIKLEPLFEARLKLEWQGYTIIDAPKAMRDLNFEVDRVMRMVGKMNVDAWIVIAARRGLLEKLIALDKPVLAIFGGFTNLPIAGLAPDHQPVIRDLVARLVSLGHKKITMFSGRRAAGSTRLGLTESNFLNTLKTHGLPIGNYNLPAWRETAEGYHDSLESLFKHTPPTALFVEDAATAVATVQFCCEKGIRIPEDLSLICFQDTGDLSMCMPPISCCRWQKGPMLKRILQWAARIDKGECDLRQIRVPTVIASEGTIGPAR